MIQITTDERDLNQDYPTEIGLIGDAKLVLRQVIDAVKDRSSAARRVTGSRSRPGRLDQAGVAREWLPRLTSDDAPISPYRVIWEMNSVFDRRNTIVTHDAGNPRDQILPFYEALTPRGYIGWGKSTHLGWGYGLMMGAKLAAPDKLSVNFMGDAAFGMTGMEVETAARERIGLLTVLINNQGMGGYDAATRRPYSSSTSRSLTGQYAKMAETLGGYGERVEGLPTSGRPWSAPRRSRWTAGRPCWRS